MKQKGNKQFWKWLSSSPASLYVFSLVSILTLFGIFMNDYFQWDKLLILTSNLSFLLVGFVFLFQSKIMKDRFHYWGDKFSDGLQGKEATLILWLFLGLFSIAIGIIGITDLMPMLTEMRGFIAVFIGTYMMVNFVVEVKKSIKKA